MKDSVASHYKGESGKKYSIGVSQNIMNHFGFQLQKNRFLPYLSKNMNVLDFGCGNGSLAKAIEPHVKSIEGVEVNDYSRGLAISENSLNVYAGLKDISQNKKYDAIISNHVLEHIPNVIETLTYLRQYIKQDGIFVTVLPIDDFRSRLNKKWNINDNDHHLHTWTPLLFGNTLLEAGYMPTNIKVVTNAWTPRLFFLGDTVLQRIAGYFLSLILKRRELLAVATIVSNNKNSGIV